MEKVKQNILIIGERFYPEEFLINDLVKHLQVNNFQCTVLTQQPSYPLGKIYAGYKNSLFSDDVYFKATVQRVSFINRYNRNVILKLINYLWFVICGVIVVLFKIKSTDKILIYQTGPLTQAIIGIVAKWKLKKPLYIWTWDIWPDSVFGYGFVKNYLTKNILDYFVKFIYSRCDFIWISSPGFRDILSKYTNKTFLDVPNWVVELPLKNDSNIDFKDGFHFTFTGNIGQVQNLENVILGFDKAFRDNQEVYFNIVGDGSNLIKLKTLVKNKGIKNVIFWGKHPVDEMKIFYSKSQVLIISLNEGSVWNLYLPSKFQNYLQEKIPLFGIIDGVVKELIETNKLGLCAPPNNLVEIKNSFLELVNNYNHFKINALLNSEKLSTKFDGNEIKALISDELNK